MSPVSMAQLHFVDTIRVPQSPLSRKVLSSVVASSALEPANARGDRMAHVYC